MRVGLLGFPPYDSNKGCEALTYSFVSVLADLYKNNNLKIVSLCGDNIIELDKSFPDVEFIGKKLRLYNLLQYINKCDVFVDCTYGDNFSDLYSLPFISRTTLYKLVLIIFHKKLILAPQTIGPFKNPFLREMAKIVLRKSKCVYSRDQVSTEYAKKIAGISAITVTDLAFLLPYQKNMYTFSGGKKVGINVSGLLWKGGFNNNNQFGLKMNYQLFIERLIVALLEKGYEIHLIPHVIADEHLTHDDDVNVSKQLSEKYGVICAPVFLTPIQAKSYISNMDCFIGSRMHSTIAAFSSGVITIPVSYSRKFQGLYSSIKYPYVIDAKTLGETEALNKVLKYLENNEQLKTTQKRSNSIIEDLENKFIKHLQETLERGLK